MIFMAEWLAERARKTSENAYPVGHGVTALIERLFNFFLGHESKLRKRDLRVSDSKGKGDDLWPGSWKPIRNPQERTVYE